MKSKFLLFPIIFMLLFSFSCKKEDKTKINTDIIFIRYGTSFGECIGYCRNEMDIEKTNVLIKTSSWDTINYPQKLCQKSISVEKWNEIAGSAGSISFNKLDSVYGCPDCADGGTEWIEITTPDWKHKVTVEFNSDQPLVLKNLLDSLREMKIYLKGCN
jgi:hypothetical protein